MSIEFSSTYLSCLTLPPVPALVGTLAMEGLDNITL